MARIVKKPDIRKQELLDIGVKLFFEVGEKEFSIQQVVQQANVATGLFYYYFKSKDEFLDEALNYYINEEVSTFGIILDNKDYSAYEKLDSVLDAYFKYVEKMLPLRSIDSFHTEKHFILTEKLIEQLKSKIENVLLQGVSENVFILNDVSITASFILHGLTSVFDPSTEITKSSLKELKKIIIKILKEN